MLQSYHRNTIFHGLIAFSLFDLILSLQTSNCKKNLYEISLILHPSYFHNTCLPHGKPYAIKPNFILDSSFLCYAWLCCHTHVHHTCYASLLFCHHHAVASCSSILICTYSMIVYKSQEINWHPQSDSLGVFPLKQTQSPSPPLSYCGPSSLLR